MRIAFDVLPVVSEHMTGIGYCQAGQMQALMTLHPEEEYVLQFFDRGNGEEKRQRLTAYQQQVNVTTVQGKFSGYLYRLLSNFLPISYEHFFKTNADITHFFNYIIPPGVTGKKVVTVHDMVYKAFPETVRGRTRYMLETGLKRSMKRADCIVTDSEFSKAEIIKYFPSAASKLRVVPCGVDRNRFYAGAEPWEMQQAKETLGIDGEYFLYLGTVEPRKNLQRLVIAYDEFRKGKETYPKLVLAGGKGWRNDALFQTLEERKLDGDVLRVDYVPGELLRPLMNGAVAFVFPSIYEGFGMPPLEAMSCGVPVLTANAASLPEVVGDCALLVDPYDTESIRQGLERLWAEPDLRKTLSEKGLERSRMFSWENAAAKLYDIYEEVLRG